ncbi:TPA: hypothetical protein NV850_003510 [Escherichia coli]|nr:hypothetical protein [Escherichia coli]HCJ9086478.1 hypothetical protein [Escherichia coli]
MSFPCAYRRPSAHTQKNAKTRISNPVRLRKYKPEEYELIIAHFVIGISLRTIAKKRKCSDGTIRKKLQAALGFIDAVIYIIHG